jgi:ribosome-associated toxin RatA of RatAB toxin-antitoxin module
LPVVVKSVLVAHAAQQMFDLVDAIEDYPGFLPWCDATEVTHRDRARTRATIRVNFRGVRQSFTTENAKEAPFLITMTLIEGPFRVLDGEWRFTALAARASRVNFRLRYEFSSRVLEKLVGPVFGHIGNTMVEAFVKRADKVHGE